MAALRRRAPPTGPRSLVPPFTRAPQGAARALSALARGLLEAVLPQRCPVCGAPVDPRRFFCEPCRERLPRFARPVCARCLLEEQPADDCHRHPGDAVHACWLYDEAVTEFVHALKFGARPALARRAGLELARSLEGSWRRPALVTGVPLHAARRRERGYDQAALLAEAVADAIGAPFVPGLLERTRATRAQSALGPRARRDNVRGAFRVTHPAWLSGRRVLVVDDVLTTGATLAECLATLRAASARPRGAVLAWAQ